MSMKAWYIATTYSAHENKVAENIKKRIESFDLEKQIFRVVVAEEKYEVKDKNGATKEKTRNLYPGYIFVEMIMTDRTWYIIRNTPGVTGIAGSSGGGTKPTPVPTNEIESVLKRIGLVDETMITRYKVGDNVKVVAGSFNGLEGQIIEIKPDNQTVSIQATFFGRSTTLEVQFSIIEKI
ncbi:MAG: transcription termination/antitermination factor NusG [Firmicutes bacterium]|nr:transcription termination/antitermination factor NusG [Candidatus Alectryobacillus merdavium]